MAIMPNMGAGPVLGGRGGGMSDGGRGMGGGVGFGGPIKADPGARFVGSFKKGGKVKATGLAKVHKGETVIPAKKKGRNSKYRTAFHVRKGGFHKWLGKKAGSAITSADIQKGISAGGHAAKMANFARNAKKWHH